MVTSSIFNVAPLATVIAPVPNESLVPPSAPPNKVPALTVVSPVKVLLPETVSSPAPALVKAVSPVIAQVIAEVPEFVTDNVPPTSIAAALNALAVIVILLIKVLVVVVLW